MKRLPTSHRKTPVSKEDKAPDFYEMSKISPLPEVTLSKPIHIYNSSLHPMGAATAASMEAAVAQGENTDAKEKKQDDSAAMLEQNMRLSNELLRRQLLELQQRENGGLPLLPGHQSVDGFPRSAAEAEMRMNHQLMQLQRERFQQVQHEQSQKEVAPSKTTMNDMQPIELNSAKGDDTKEEEGKAPDTNGNDDKKDEAKVSPMVKDLIARYNKEKQ